MNTTTTAPTAPTPSDDFSLLTHSSLLITSRLIKDSNFSPNSNSSSSTSASAISPNNISSLSSNEIDNLLGNGSNANNSLYNWLTNPSSWEYSLPNSVGWESWKRAWVGGLPDGVMEESEASNDPVTLGLFPQIGRAYATVGKRIFLWEWMLGDSSSSATNGNAGGIEDSNVNTFDDVDDVIISVGLVSPKPGLFIPEIQHLLLISTPTSLTLLGLSTTPAPTPSNPQKTSLSIYLTGLSTPTYGKCFGGFCDVEGNGRVFCVSLASGGGGGTGVEGGNLNEICYQSEEGWFSKKCWIKDWSKSGGWIGSLIPRSSSISSSSSITSSGGDGRKLNPNDRVKIIIDSERGLLYCLLRGNSIEMYTILSAGSSGGAGGKMEGNPTLLTKATDLCRQALVLCPGSGSNTNNSNSSMGGGGGMGMGLLDPRTFRLVTLEVVSKKEAGRTNFGLVGITSTGVRLYFEHRSRSYYSEGPTLELRHVRLPPTTQTLSLPNPTPTPYSHHQQPQQQQQLQIPSFGNVYSAAQYKGGLFVAATTSPDGRDDYMLFGAPEAGRMMRSLTLGGGQDGGMMTGRSGMGMGMGNQPGSGGGIQQASQIIDSASILGVDGTVWALAEISPNSESGASGFSPNELSTQMIQSTRRQILVLTNVGISLIVRLRPVDVLINLLGSGAGGAGSGGAGGGGRDTDIVSFFDIYGRDQTCAMCLLISSNSPRLSSSSHDLISPSFSSGSINGSGGAAPEVIHTAKRILYEAGGKPSLLDRGYAVAANPATPISPDGKVIYSGRHEALVYCLARLLQPLWRVKVIITGASGEQAPGVSESTLVQVQRDLAALRKFVDNEWPVLSAYPDHQRSSFADQEAFDAEQRSLQALRRLLAQSVEAISFILLVIDYKLAVIFAACPDPLKQVLQTLTWQELLTTQKGKEVAQSLVGVIINQQIGQQLGIDAISDILQQRCGSFCSADDVVLYKAIENLRRARDAKDASEKSSNLNEALRLLLKATKQLTEAQLKEICSDFNSLRFPTGSVELSLSCASVWDPHDDGLSFWQEGQPPMDPRQGAYERRRRCYECVTQSLADTDELFNQASYAATRILNRGVDITPEEADAIRANAFKRALAAEDEPFHHFLYDWYISLGKTDQLLRVQTRYIEAYLQRPPITLEKNDLLWQYYVRNAEFLKAAQVLSHLADTSSFSLSLALRAEYLSLAVGNAKSYSPTASNRVESIQFLQELEEKLEVAHVQVEIYRTIMDSGELDQRIKEVCVMRLDERLYSISELYIEFAQPLDLYEMQLCIFHVSEYSDDPQVVERLWPAILNHVAETTDDASLVEAVSFKFSTLARRFYPVTFPLRLICEMLERFSYEDLGSLTREGWVPACLHEGGVPYDDLFPVYDEMIRTKNPPWQTTPSLLFLARDLTHMLEAWVNEHHPSSSSYSHPQGTVSSFPAGPIDDATGRYVMHFSSLGNSESGARELVQRMQTLQREVRRRF